MRAPKSHAEAPVDLRSDTVTQPTAEMRARMAHAEVGDDVFGEDPTVHALETLGAELLGQQAALFVPSGTMANQIAILTHCRRGDDVMVGEGSHSYLYESGAGAVLAGVQFTVAGRGGHFDATTLKANFHTPDVHGHIAPTGLVMVENTHNRGGGKVMTPAAFAEISEQCGALEVPLHIDGARLFNAAVACDAPAAAWGALADSVSVCLSKGLGAPVGSLLCGSAAFIGRAHRYRKMLGGGMRQAGIIAAGGLHALQNHVGDLAADHRRAQTLAAAVASLPGVRLDPATVQTNIVIFEIDGSPAELCAAVAKDVRLLPFGPTAIRAVLHRDIDDAAVERAIAALRGALSV